MAAKATTAKLRRQYSLEVILSANLTVFKKETHPALKNSLHVGPPGAYDLAFIAG